MKLHLFSALYALCQLTEAVSAPEKAALWSLSVTPEEISLVCAESQIPAQVQSVERGWKALQVAGMLDFGMVGVIAAISAVLAAAKISIFVVSTYNTDYILVKETALEAAISQLQSAGYEVEREKS
jgi:hypothetical protein